MATMVGAQIQVPCPWCSATLEAVITADEVVGDEVHVTFETTANGWEHLRTHTESMVEGTDGDS